MPYKIPFKCDGLLYSLPVIYISINDSVPHPFVLDTGTNLPMIIDKATAEQLNLDLSKQAVDSPFGPLWEVDLHRVQVCGIDARNHLTFRGFPWAFVADLAVIASVTAPERIAGIIGAPVIREAIALFDFDTHILTLTWEATRLTIPKATGVALQEFNGQYLVDAVVAQTAKVKLLVDTGATVSSLPISAIRRHTAKTTYSLRLTSRGFVCRRKAVVSSLAIGNRTVRNVAVDLAAEEPGRYAQGKLGIDILSRFNTLLDLKRHQLALLPRSKIIPHPSIGGATGISVEKTEGGVYIAEISQWSPARHTSLRPGDRLLAIDEHRIDAFPIGVIKRLLDGWADTEAKLLSRRDEDKPTVVRFRRLSEFDLPIELRIDCDMMKRPNEPLVVLYVPPSSKMKGILQPGDRILEIGGVATAPMEMETVLDTLMEPSEVTEITVKRGDGKVMIVKIPR